MPTANRIPRGYKGRIERVLRLRQQAEESMRQSLDATGDLIELLTQEGLAYAKIGQLLGGVSRQRVHQMLLAKEKRTRRQLEAVSES